MLRQPSKVEEDAENALAQAAGGLDQEEEDRAPYCSPAYVEMETGAAWLALGRPSEALTVFEESRAQLNGSTQIRDHVLCLARLATAYAVADEVEEACNVAEEALTLTQSIGSVRVAAQLRRVRHRLARWSRDPTVTDLIMRLDRVAESFPSPRSRPEGAQ
ncbi:hypothetical protein [Actinomadura sediminis]|uniref:Tetratricopeptide repeat protein n=1 Tax=Actinomadura sediminis TaxID=1038904 RepID=A0ABW3EPT6_9ACTN